MSGGAVNLGFDDGAEPDGRPRQWHGAAEGYGTEGYELAVDSSISHSPGASGRIRSLGYRGPDDFGTLAQRFAADAFRGSVVRYSGFLKTADVRGWAGLWLRVDGTDGKQLRFDNMNYPVDRSIAGSTDWTQYEIVLDVPAEAADIYFGFLLSGTGTVWADDLGLEKADDSPGSSAELANEINDQHTAYEPENLGFDDGAEPGGRPSRWGGGGQGYELAVDWSIFHSPGASGRIRSVSQRGPSGFGTGASF